MPVLNCLSLSVLRYIACEAMKAAGLSNDTSTSLASGSGKIASVVVNYFTDHSGKLTAALGDANERSWKVLELALAGDSFWDRCKAVLQRSEDQALAQQVRGFLDRTILADQPGRGQNFRMRCLDELRTARRTGVLNSGSMDRDALEREAGSFARYTNPLAVLEAEWLAVGRMADELHSGGYGLVAQLLRLRTGQEFPLLVVAARYYFSRAIQQDTELFQGLAFAKLEALSDSQQENFQQLADLLERHSGRLEGLLTEVQAVVVETHGGVLRIEQQLAALVQQMAELSSRLGMRDQRVRSTDTVSFQRRPEDLQRFEELQAQFEALPDTARRGRPDLMNVVARLENAAGKHDSAVEHFKTVATLITDNKPAQAEAHYNAYRAALEKASKSRKKEDWNDALDELKLAINRDRKLMPFDALKYHPQQILGAGGFGVTFLCKRRNASDLVAVKSLASELLDRDTDKVLDEGRILLTLDHPAIIRVFDCDYVDPEARMGPYLVMAYFEGQTLEDHVHPRTFLPVEEAVPLFLLVAEGLQAAHARGVLHRDIKPANLLIRKVGETWQAKIIDFGLALRRELTQEGMNASTSRQRKSLLGESVGGTLHYGAPEQMDAERQQEIGPWSDVFAFGKTFYYALFGTPTPDDDDKDTLPDGLKRLLSRCTAQIIARRPQSFTEVVKQLKEVETALAPTIEVVEPVEAIPVIEEDQWFYIQAGQQSGPVSEDALRKLIEQGQLRRTDLLWKRGMPAWLAVESEPRWARLLPRKSVANLRLFSEGKSYGYNPFAALGGIVKSLTDGTVLKVKIDGRLIGESHPTRAFEYRLELPLGEHTMELSMFGKWMEWEEGGFIGSRKDHEGEMDRIIFEFRLDEPRSYEVKINVAVTGVSSYGYGRPSLQNSTVDIIS